MEWFYIVKGLISFALGGILGIIAGRMMKGE